MIKKIVLSLLVLFALGAIVLLSYMQLNKSPQLFEPSIGGLYHTDQRLIDPDSLRTTTNGDVIGFADAYDTQAWLGIPYAAPPVGDLRWRAPQPTEHWQGIRQATEYGPPCVQFWGVLAGEEGENGQVVGSEDCLTLNIWAPKQAANNIGVSNEKTPVMVWIHGGGNDSGTANLYQAHHLAGSKNVMVVLINYRVGMFGWLSHTSIRDTATNLKDASGNFGTLDIIASLQWVQDNIAQFGGDPDNVTIFGESAGGRNVFSMLASPLAAGLFHKAIVQSGSADTTRLTLAEDFVDDKSDSAIFGLKNSSNGLVALALGHLYPDKTRAQIRSIIKDMPGEQLLDLMRNIDAEKLMILASQNSGVVGDIKVARVLRDGHVIPKQSVLSLFKDPNSYNHVPLMMGSNRDEQKLFMSRNPDYVSYLFGALPRIKDEQRYNRVSDYVSINWKAGAVDEPAKLISTSDDAEVYAYRFDWDEAPSNWLADLPSLLGAAHGFEISFVFGDFIGGTPTQIINDRHNAQGRRTLSLAMMDYWAEFAHSGNPGRGQTGSHPLWQSWQAEGENIMLLDSDADGGIRMAEVRNNVVDIKANLASDDILTDQRDRCEAYAVLFLHGYQASDFWSPEEYIKLGCEAYPAGDFRDS